VSITIGLVANVYNEVCALPGWLETHLPFFDDVRVLHAGPQGVKSNDGTIELLEKWRVPVEFCAIDEGFGAVRTRAIHMSPCDYVMILDADERFYPVHRRMRCGGESTPQHDVDRILRSYHYRDGNKPDWDSIDKLGSGLRVEKVDTYDQGAYLRDVLEIEKPDAITTVRRHWHDFSFRRPSQNWHTDPDWQTRIVKNGLSVYFDYGTRMHERIVGVNHAVRANMDRGPFFDHFHLHFKQMEEKQRRHDIEIYDAIHAGKLPPVE